MSGETGHENVALWGTRRTLEELVAAGDSVNASLRAELGLEDAILAAQAWALDPPFSLRFFRGSKVAVPAFVDGCVPGTLRG